MIHYWPDLLFIALVSCASVLILRRMSERKELLLLRELVQLQLAQLDEEREQTVLLRHIIRELRPPVSGFVISQGACMAITGITAGQSGTFVATPTPSGAVLPAGNIPSWASDQSSVALTPSADGLSVQAAVPADATFTTVNLTITAQPLGDGSQPSATVAVPVTPIVVPPPQVTGFDISQTA